MPKRLIVRGPGMRGPAGRDGRDGLNVVPTDEALAVLANDADSEFREAMLETFVASPDIRQHLIITQTAYAALDPKSPTTLYYVIADA